MKIGIDARFLTHPQKGGFKTYTENLIAALAQVDVDNEYVLYLDRPPLPHTKLPRQPNFSTRIVPGQIPIVGFPWREQVGLTRQIVKDRVDLLHSPCLTAPLHLTCSLIVTIHDMIWFFPKKFSQGNTRSVRRKLMEWYYHWIPQYAAKKASAIITVSQAAKESIGEFLRLDGKRIFITHEAASPLFRQVNDDLQIKAVRCKYHLPPAFILAIGSTDPRKNIKTLVQAYALLPVEFQARFHLVIVWTHSFLAAELTRYLELLRLTERVQFLEQVPDEDLVLIYNAATLFVFPSLYEGFGLPVLEAMACGTPVVAANNSSIPEIAGEAALFVDAQDPRMIAEMMRLALCDRTLRANLTQKGLERVKNFSWEKCARATINVYRQALGNSRRRILDAHSFRSSCV